MSLRMSVHFLEKPRISSSRKRFCDLRLGLQLRLELGLAKIRFRSNVFSSKFSRSDPTRESDRDLRNA